MDFVSIFSSSIIFVLLFGFQSLLILGANSNLKTYIIHVQSPVDLELGNNTDHDQKVDLESWYHSFLPATTTNGNIGEESKSKSRSRLVYSYKHVFNGFAARLTREEVKEIKKKKGFISAQPQEILSLQTTHSPEYMGLIQNSDLWKNSNYGKGVIIGVLDSGVTPKHPSFRGHGVRRPPAKWKGICQFDAVGKKSFCNHKLIGIRYFVNGSAKDENGHGTHIASIAAGNYVHGANVYGNVNGTTKGVAPLAHLAIYKVCDSKLSCEESALIAGMDAAITDGVDVISISINSKSKPFHMNNVAIGAFRAMERGIFVSLSAGNQGPSLRTLTEEAPWMLIVGASTTDRRTIAVAKLGNGKELKGQSLYQPDDFPSTMFPLVYPKSLNPKDEGNPYCWPDSFDYNNIEGKIVVCIEGGGISRIDKGVQVKNARGVGMILMNNKESGYTIEDELHVLPTTQLSYVDGLRVIDYIESSKSPIATILFKGISFDNDQSKSPVVASFSSRGPSVRSRGILKPDILGPGVNIIAAWPFTIASEKDEKNAFNMLTGTSMACPHLSGVAALLKSAHKDWSPAAIMSAIITTAEIFNHEGSAIMDEQYHRANIFATGAGFVNPSKANNPGLIYNIHRINDYLSYLCGLKYNDHQVSLIAKRNIKCSKETSIAGVQLNYPSISVFLGFDSTVVQFQRTVTNVGDAVESYSVYILEPPGVKVKILPTTLSFQQIKQNLTYEVTFKRLATATGEFSEGSIIWTSIKHTVRSPIVATFTDRL